MRLSDPNKPLFKLVVFLAFVFVPLVLLSLSPAAATLLAVGTPQFLPFIARQPYTTILPPPSSLTPTPTGPPTATPQPGPLFESALLLDGVDDYAIAEDHPSLDLGLKPHGDFTIEAFFFVPNLNMSGEQHLVKREVFDLTAYFKPSNLYDILEFDIVFNDGDAHLTHQLYLSTGWHHIAGVLNADAPCGGDFTGLYMDGVLRASQCDTTWDHVKNSSRLLYVGGDEIHPFEGWIEEVRLSDFPRYTGSTYSVPFTPFTPDSSTRALWHFDEATGSTHFGDYSPNLNTLTGLNGAQTGKP